MGEEGLAKFNEYYRNKISGAAVALARPVKCGGNGFGELTKF
jgi:hypothetical protein